MRSLVFLSLILCALTAVANKPIPILVDAVVVDAMEGPFLEPAEFNFQPGQEYVLVLQNENDYSVNFYYDKFGQDVLTLFLQGTPDVFQTGFGIPSHSRVLWHFSPSPNKLGEYAFYLSNTAMNRQGKNGKILIGSLQEIALKNKIPDENVPLAKNTNEKRSVLDVVLFRKK